MKSYYDIVGSGEGISGLVACVLLSHKGFSCLWVDTGCQPEHDSGRCGIPLLVTRGFWDNGVRPILSSVDMSLADSFRPRALGKIQAVMPGKRFDVGPGPINGDASLQQKNTVKYLRLLEKSMTRPGALLRASTRSVPDLDPWQKDQITALCRTGRPNYVSYLRWTASLTGLYSMDYAAAKDVLGKYLPKNRSDCIRADRAEMIVENGSAAGLSVRNTQVRSRYCISETLPGSHGRGGFVFYGTCVIDEHVIPMGMGDMLVVSPPEDMHYPLILLLERREGKGILSVTTKVPVGGGILTSRTELLSWAAGMIHKRLRQVIPYLDQYLDGFEFIDPFDADSTRPWFRYADEVRVPWFVSVKRYMRQQNKVFICNGMQYGWLDTEGEILWGICTANAILRDLNRSDLITGRPAQAIRV